MKPPHLTSTDAAKILKRVKPEYSFKLHSGSDIENLNGLAVALKLMSDSTFRHHVSKDRNDFSSWIMDVVGDEELADSIRKIHNRDELRRKVEQRIRFLEKLSLESGVSAFFMRNALLEFGLGLLLGILAGILISKLL